METAKEKVMRSLLTHPKNTWKQKELADKAGCSKAFLSKLTKKFISEGILTRPYNQQLVLVSYTKLLNKWSGERKMPQPVYIKTEMKSKRVEQKLKKMESYALTLFSAAWHRIKFMKTNTVEVYVHKDLKPFIKTFGKKSKDPTTFSIFPIDEEIEGSEKINGLSLVSVVQNYVDLMSYGGNGARVAFELAKKYELIK